MAVFTPSCSATTLTGAPDARTVPDLVPMRMALAMEKVSAKAFERSWTRRSLRF